MVLTDANRDGNSVPGTQNPAGLEPVGSGMGCIFHTWVVPIPDLYGVNMGRV